MRLDSAAIEQGIQQWVDKPPPEAQSFSAMSLAKTMGKAPVAGTFDVTGGVADLSSLIAGEDWWLTQAGKKDGSFDLPQFSATVGNASRRKADEFAPDPMTASKADQVVGGILRGVTKAVGAVATMGPYAGGALFGLEEANNQYQRMVADGIDPGTAAKVAGITGVVSAVGAGAPAGASTWLKTLGLIGATGPGAYVAQETLSRDILARAGYQSQADTHDPTDAVGLLISIGVPGAIGALHMRGVGKQQAALDTASGRLDEIVKHIESGGRRYAADGELLTSPKGAQGEMQVMPATARDPGFGIKPAADDSPEELARVGREYRRAMLERYKGDTDKMFAAYNAGPGAVDAAVKAHGDGWLAHMPDETRGYVGKANGLMRDGTVKAGASSPEIVDAARVRVLDAAVARSLPDRPTAFAEVMRASDEVAAGNVHENLAPPAGPADTGEVIGFTTAKGSTYTIDGESTTRDKAARPEHPGESGPQPPSERTFYVSAEDAVKLGEIQTQGAGLRAIEQLPDGRFGIKYLEGPGAGKFEGRTVITPLDGPAVGRTPVELWDGGRKAHFGNEITEVRTAPRAGPATAGSATGSVPPPRHREPANALPPRDSVTVEPPAAAGTAKPEPGAPTPPGAGIADKIAAERPDLLVKLPGSDETITAAEALERIKAEQAEDAQAAEWVEIAMTCALNGGWAPRAGATQ